MRRSEIDTYLNDHLAGSSGGLATARRLARRYDAEAGEQLAQLAREIGQDREVLREVMSALGARESPFKRLSGWLARPALALHDLLRPARRGAPATRLLELEALSLGVEGKASLWRALRHAYGAGGSDGLPELDPLIERAERQRAMLEPLRLEAARESKAARRSG